MQNNLTLQNESFKVEQIKKCNFTNKTKKELETQNSFRTLKTKTNDRILDLLINSKSLL